MYHSNGNYEAFARPVKPADVDRKSAYLVGSGLAGLAAAVFLIRDGQMKGNRIHIFEEFDLPGGSLDGIHQPSRGFIIRGGREMENHFECLWDLFRSVPSLEVKDASVLDEFYWLNKRDPFAGTVVTGGIVSVKDSSWLMSWTLNRQPHVDRGVPEVFASMYDIRTLMGSSARLMDGKKIMDLKIPFLTKHLKRKLIDKTQGTIIYELLKDSGLI